MQFLSVHTGRKVARPIMIMYSNFDAVRVREFKISARESIPIGVFSKVFELQEFVVSSRRCEIATVDNIYLAINKENTLILKGIVDPALHVTWPVYLSLAPDVHSSNIQLEITPLGPEKNGGKCRLRVTRDIPAKTELKMWFSDEIVIMLNMPFLTPNNILGKNVYKCHMCGAQFEFPNPLKIHMLLSCGSDSLDSIWGRIVKANCEQYKPLNLSIERCSIVRSFSEPPSSAFKPYKIEKGYNNNNAVTMTPQIYEATTLPNPFQRIPWMDDDLRMKFLSLDEISQRRAAEVETLASNWGKSKQGHLCIYCGKVYSRKYGLKIHIRTHTGYKPLQCKYCNRPFGDPSNLNKHVRLHAHSETPYTCHLCGKVLVRKRDLDRHLKSRHSHSFNLPLSPQSS